MPGAQHIWCRVHQQQGVTHGLPQQCKTDAAITARTPAMTQVWQTRDTRTVRRRLARLRARAAAWGMLPWVQGVEAKLPPLIGSVGSVRLPSTTHAVERFFRACERFYKPRTGVHAVLSAKRELVLFCVVSVFTPRDSTGHAPLAVIVPEARRMPRSRVINAPFRALQARGHVKGTPHMADVLRPEEATA